MNPIMLIIGGIAGLIVVGLSLYVAYAVVGVWGALVLLGVFAYTAYQELVHGRNIWAKDSITIIDKDGNVKTYEEK